jgi:hypothetical protein
VARLPSRTVWTTQQPRDIEKLLQDMPSSILSKAKQDGIPPKLLIHPDQVTSLPPFGPEVHECYTSWLEYFKIVREGTEFQTQKTASPTIGTDLLEFETLISLGPNATSVDCGGITRLHFETITRTTSSVVTVIATRNHDRGNIGISPDTPPYPTCTDLDPHHCRRLYGMDEVGGDAYEMDTEWTYNMMAQPGLFPWFEKVCPMWYGCSPVLHEVVLLYWPENVVTRDACGSDGHGASITRPWNRAPGKLVTATRDIIKFRGQDLYIRRINGRNMTGEQKFDGGRYRQGGAYPDGNYLLPWTLTTKVTFTSPTMYLAHRPISRRWMAQPRNVSWSTAFGTEVSFLPAGIITLNSTDIFSVRPDRFMTLPGLEYARQVAQGSFHNTLNFHVRVPVTEKQPFDFGNILDPVPASVYFDARSEDCWGNQTHCATITDGSYRPKLRLAPKVWKSIFGGSMCSDPMLADPPNALERIDGAVEEEQVVLPDLPATLTAAVPHAGGLGWPDRPPDGQSVPVPGYIPEHGLPRPTQSVPDRKDAHVRDQHLGLRSDGSSRGGGKGKGTGGAVYDSGGYSSFGFMTYYGSSLWALVVGIHLAFP